MEFTKTINLRGVVEIENVSVNVSMNYNNDVAPTEATFNFNVDNKSVNGNCTQQGISYYSVNSGIISDEIMTAIEIKLLEYLKDYKTI